MFLAAAVSCGGGSKKQVKGESGKSGKAGCELCGEATGYAQIFDGDQSLARDRAIDDAMNKLVGSKLGTFVAGTSGVEDFALVSSIVEAKTSGMVRNWKVLKEGAQEGSFVITIYGEVFPQAVNDTIEATLKNYGRPKFMVLIRETFEGKQNMPGFTVTELTMMEIMGNSGFECVDAGLTQQLMRRDAAKMQQAMAGQVKGAVQDFLMDAAGAEVVIVGEVKTSDQSGAIAAYSKNMKSKQAIVNIKAIDMYTGAILATTSANAPGVHIDGDAASKTAIQNCLKRIPARPTKTPASSSPALHEPDNPEISPVRHRQDDQAPITGLDFAELTKFRNEVQNRVRGVKKVYSRGQAGRAAKVEVEFAGKTDDLAQELNAKSQALGFEIEIKETYPNKITIAAKKL